MPLYDTIGHGYAARRKPDPRIAALIHAALGDAVSIANIGAGTGSYEPADREVIAIEPSEVMIRQRPPGAARCIQAAAESLPLADASVDAAMTILSLHHWTDVERGLREMARIARKRVVIMTWVPDLAPFWLTEDYFPEILAHDRTIFPSVASLTQTIEHTIAPVRLIPVPIPHDCIDGMLCAYWRRPDAYLDDSVRSGMSSFTRINAAPGLAKLRADLERRTWATRHARLLDLDELDLGYRLAVCNLARN